MRRCAWALVAVLCILPLVGWSRQPDRALRAVARFEHVDVFVDSASVPLGAYQVEVKGTPGQVMIVGIEGGEHAAFKDPPYYDPRAMEHERVILGAFSLGEQLPTGRTRVARLHIRTTGDTAPEYSITLVTAATAGGAKISATAQVGQGEGK